MISILKAIVLAFWDMTLEMAPFLFLGFAIAGLLSVLVSPELVERHLGRRGIGSAFKACLFGIPLPLCSCGVIPVAASIHSHGASRGATAAFLLSTPQTGVDSILVTHSLLGPVFAIFRPVVALITGVLGGGIVEAVADHDEETETRPTTPALSGEPIAARLRHALQYGFWDLPTELARPMLAGIVIAAVITVFAPENLVELVLGGGIASMLLMLAIGVPTYVCATASVPIAAALIAKGATPGAAFVFLMTGPATNAAAISVIWKVLGRRTAIVYLATVAVVALVSGFVLDRFVASSGIAPPEHVHHMIPGVVRIVLGVALLALIGAAALPRKRVPMSDGAAGGPTLTLVIEGMTCNHCAESVQRALRECEGVTDARVDLTSGHAIVSTEGAQRPELRSAVESLGYTVSTVEETRPR